MRVVWVLDLDGCGGELFLPHVVVRMYVLGKVVKQPDFKLHAASYHNSGSKHKTTCSESLQGCSRKHFQFFPFRDITILPSGPSGPPPQELAVFGRTILEDVDRTLLPHLPSLLQVMRWCVERIVFDEIDLDNSKIFNVS